MKEELEYWENILEELPKYPTPLLNHAIGYVKAKIERLKKGGGVMSLNKARKRLIRKLEDRERKLLSISEFLRMFEEKLLETRKANLRRLLVAGSPFRGGKVWDGASWREY